MAKRILIVDDEPSIRKVLQAHLKRFGYEVEAAADGAEAVARLSEDLFHLVVTDLKMPGMDGMELLSWVAEQQPGLPVIMITAHGTVDTAVEAIKRGAFDYVSKPFDRDELQQVIEKGLATGARDTWRVQPAPAGGGSRYGIIGRTPAMLELFAMVEKVAPSPTTVLILGESGTGKELIARALHENSERRHGPFIRINCGAIPESLFEAELFGHEKGAFTGAVASKPGRFELAHGGTLFLDEVGELPRDLQVKILRALQERRIDRVGGVRPIDVDVRLVAATNVDLQKAVAEGAFRGDLYYRLSVIPVSLPPLRDRPQDIPLLVEHFIRQFNQRLGKRIVGVTDSAMRALVAHPWPGNIRELENLMERSVLLSDGERIDVPDLPGLRGGEPEPEEPSEAGSDEEIDQLDLKEYVRVHTARLERARIQRVLEAEEGNVTRAARRLGISRKSLQTKMKEYGLRDR